MTQTTPPTPAAQATKWKWSVSFETATIAKGTAQTKDAAELLAVTTHDDLVVKGFNPDALAWHVDAVAPVAATKQRGATKAQLAYRAKLFAPIAHASPSIHDDLARLRASVGQAMALTPSQKRIADMLRRAGHKVTVIDATKDPKVVADEVLRAEQDRRCPDCQNWLDRYGRCLQCQEPAGES